MTGRADFYSPGDWNVVCYECGRKRKASMMKKHWKGYYVCPEHWEPREQQDFVRAVPDVQTPGWTQAMPADIFLDEGEFLITEASNTLTGDFEYILSEDNYPLTMES